VAAPKGSNQMETPDLKREQAKTLATPRLRYGWLARLLFLGMDIAYGRRRTLPKFRVLELIARVPYQSWEHVAYIAMTHKYRQPQFARRIFEFVAEARHQQDNEQWHLLILVEMIHAQGIEEGFLRYRALPQLVAFFYYQVSWLLYVISPRLSYELNAHFEDHAEHEYMEYVRDNPDLENTPFESSFELDYGAFANQADLFRRIGLDEREHKEESLARAGQARFS